MNDISFWIMFASIGISGISLVLAKTMFNTNQALHAKIKSLENDLNKHRDVYTENKYSPTINKKLTIEQMFQQTQGLRKKPKKDKNGK